MSRSRFDVLVVGGGPAGSVAALVLARGGVRVALVDKSAFPRDKAFWIDQSVGRRLCALIDAILTLDPRPFATDEPSRGDIDRLLENLVLLGFAEAYQLEDKLRVLQ